MPIPWLAIAGLGASLGGNILGARSQNQGSERQWQLLQQELQRRNMLQGMIGPQLLRSAGIRNPQQIAQMTRQIQGVPGANGFDSPDVQVPRTPNSVGNTIGGSILGGPVVGALANKIGHGHRTANVFVDTVENPTAQQMMGASSLEELQRAYQSYQQQAQAWIAKGGDNAKVAQQSLNNPKLQQTIDALFQKFGGHR